jgi:hypothetical protein
MPLLFLVLLLASDSCGPLPGGTGAYPPPSGSLSVSFTDMRQEGGAWGTLRAFTATSYPVVVNRYLVGDYGILIRIGAVIGIVLVGRMLRRGMDEAQEVGAVLDMPPPPAATAHR